MNNIKINKYKYKLVVVLGKKWKAHILIIKKHINEHLLRRLWTLLAWLAAILIVQPIPNPTMKDICFVYSTFFQPLKRQEIRIEIAIKRDW